jgi:hypothetical protein
MSCFDMQELDNLDYLISFNSKISKEILALVNMIKIVRMVVIHLLTQLVLVTERIMSEYIWNLSYEITISHVAISPYRIRSLLSQHFSQDF